MYAIIASMMLFMVSCNSCKPNNEMDYSYKYITETNVDQAKAIDTPTNDSSGLKSSAVELPLLSTWMEVVDELGPNIYVIETKFSLPIESDINAISMVVVYDSNAVNFLEKVIINDKLYINEYESISDAGITLFNNTGKDLRYSFATLQEVKVTNEFVFRIVVEILQPTKLVFSDVPGELEFVNINAEIYPLEWTYIEFEKK
jgi:hypothetical protein